MGGRERHHPLQADGHGLSGRAERRRRAARQREHHRPPARRAPAGRQRRYPRLSVSCSTRPASRSAARPPSCSAGAAGRARPSCGSSPTPGRTPSPWAARAPSRTGTSRADADAALLVNCTPVGMYPSCPALPPCARGGRRRCSMAAIEHRRRPPRAHGGSAGQEGYMPTGVQLTRSAASASAREVPVRDGARAAHGDGVRPGVGEDPHDGRARPAAPAEHEGGLAADLDAGRVEQETESRGNRRCRPAGARRAGGRWCSRCRAARRRRSALPDRP